VAKTVAIHLSAVTLAKRYAMRLESVLSLKKASFKTAVDKDAEKNGLSANTSVNLCATRKKNAQSCHVKLKCVFSVNVDTDGFRLFVNRIRKDPKSNVILDAGRSREMKKLLMLLEAPKISTITRAQLNSNTTQKRSFNLLKITWSGLKR